MYIYIYIYIYMYAQLRTFGAPLIDERLCKCIVNYDIARVRLV